MTGLMRRALGYGFMHVVIAKPLHTFARHALGVGKFPAARIIRELVAGRRGYRTPSSLGRLAPTPAGDDHANCEESRESDNQGS
ncbi:hypothetical protein MES5069_110040 [Mesorhizobium escarrei]|uniref:Uncharacterized protein n=1 Tax=Mesorhizobium escarrei TaxID=666018 RepID=A0ABN8JBM7_9HYPH|nr:hypothetical protein MES5069_110040 [Mesorhizobium escarrei]